MKGREVTTHDGGTEPMEQPGHRIQHQPLATIAEHVRVVKYQRKENAKGQK